MPVPKCKIRLFVTDDLGVEKRLEPTSSQSHYLFNVMRVREADAVSLFNGRDGEWRALVTAGSGKKSYLRIIEQVRRQEPEVGPWLAFAPLKKTPMDFIAAKATELGVSRLIAVLTENTAVRRFNAERMRANATEAAEQCRRLSVPEIAGPVSLESLISQWPERKKLLVADETGGGVPIYDALANPDGRIMDCGFLVGPEGGFTRSELDRLGKLPFAGMVGLGPLVLRAETAVLSMLACWRAAAEANNNEKGKPNVHR